MAERNAFLMALWKLSLKFYPDSSPKVANLTFSQLNGGTAAAGAASQDSAEAAPEAVDDDDLILASLEQDEGPQKGAAGACPRTGWGWGGPPTPWGRSHQS